jgi:hypothetical protein
VKFDNSKVRCPFVDGRGQPTQFYGAISAIFTHEAWPSGPVLCVLDVDWYTNHGTCLVSGNPLVGPPEDRSRGLKKDRSQCYC